MSPRLDKTNASSSPEIPAREPSAPLPDLADLTLGEPPWPLMNAPATGWAEVATKRDLDHLREITEARFDQLGSQLRAEFHKSISWHTVTIVFATMASNAMAVFAVAQLR